MSTTITWEAAAWKCEHEQAPIHFINSHLHSGIVNAGRKEHSAGRLSMGLVLCHLMDFAIFVLNVIKAQSN